VTSDNTADADYDDAAKVGGVVRFEADSGFVVAAPAALGVATGEDTAFTVRAVVKLDAASPARRVLTLGSAEGGVFLSTALQIRNASDAVKPSVSRDAATPLSTGEWHSIAVAVVGRGAGQGGVVRLYQDGEPVGAYEFPTDEWAASGFALAAVRRPLAPCSAPQLAPRCCHHYCRCCRYCRRCCRCCRNIAPPRPVVS
jgi:hypothetical protein